jgi:hypothetical protein
MSSTGEVSRAAQGFIDQGSTTVGPGLEVEAELVSVYRESDGTIGLIGNFQKSLVSKIGTDGIGQMISKPSASESLRIDFDSYHVQISVPIALLVSGGNLLNVIRLTSSRIDFMAGTIQDDAPSIRMPSNQTPVVLFGGRIEGRAVDFMSLAFFDPISRLPGFLPNSGTPSFGVNFPGNAPAGLVPELIPVTATLKGIFSRVFRNPDRSLKNGIPANFDAFDAYPDRFFLAVYRDGGTLVEAKAVYLSTVPSAASDTFSFCDSSFNDVDNFIYGAFPDGALIQGTDPRACDCTEPLYSTSDSNSVPANLIASDPCSTANRKKQPILDAIAANPAPPSQGYFSNTVKNYGEITVTPKP